MGRLLHTSLFVASLPILFASLLTVFVTAKRWGRVSFFHIGAGALLWAPLAVRAPVLFAVLVVSTASLVVLALLRTRDWLRSDGNFLDDSQAVAWPAMLGGAFVAVALHAIAPKRGVSAMVGRAETVEAYASEELSGHHVFRDQW